MHIDVVRLTQVCIAMHQMVVMASSRPHLPSAASFLHQNCEVHHRDYQSIIAQALAQYMMNGISVKDLLTLQGWVAEPQVVVVNNTLFTMGEAHLNVAAHLVPLLQRISRQVHLPDVIMAADLMDQPEDDIARRGGPWFGYCNIMSQTTNLMYPSGHAPSQTLGCGSRCIAFARRDAREPRAVFLGSSTGWLSGRRRAVVLAGILHPEHVYSGFTQLIDVDETTIKDKDPRLADLKPVMTLAEQVKKYKYIINVDGHCAALRLRDLLASDSAVFWVETNEAEWFYPLLLPFVHYIPVRYFPHEADPLSDIVAKVDWANQHPSEIARIVTNAHQFVSRHLTETGMTCYSVQLLHEYAGIFTDPWRLQQLASQGSFHNAVKHDTA